MDDFFHQEKAPFQKSVMGCIRDFRFSKILLSEPTVNRGAAPCFKGTTAKGAYFAGDGAHVFLGSAHLYLYCLFIFIYYFICVCA